MSYFHQQTVLCCENGPSGPSLPALPHHTCINYGTPASSDPPECRGTCRHHLVAEIPANLERHCQVMLLYTDTYGSYGCGAYYQGAWFFYAWRPHQHLQSIRWKEQFTIVAAALTWGHYWQGKRVKFMCDNQVIVLAWQGQHIMKLMRILFMFAAQHHFTITVQHLQLASRCHLPQTIHQISFSCSTGTPRSLTCSTPFKTQHLQHLLHLSTRQSYHTEIKLFISFFKTQHVCPLPCSY